MVAIPSGFSPQEYLALEAEHSIRHEFRQGLVYAMAGNSDVHSRININLLTLINLHLRDSECQFFAGDVKVNYADDFFYYPDAFVTCDSRDQENHYIKKFPKLIVEILSPSTEKFDRSEKFTDYQKLESLEEYVLIDQNSMNVECRRRVLQAAQNDWDLCLYRTGDVLKLQSVNLNVAMEELYRGVGLSEN
jgi:Uma2 family endonuclease